MKNKLNKTFKLIILSLGISFFLWNCEKEEYSEKLTQTEVKSNRLDIKIMSWDDLEKSKNKITSKVNFLKEKNSEQKIIASSENDFFIEESSVQIIEQENFTTYTFFVYRDNQEDNILENYSYKEFNDGSYEQYLLKYNYTNNNHGLKVFNPDVLEVKTINDDGLVFNNFGCSYELIDVDCTYNTVCTGDGHEVGEECECTSSPTTCDPAGSTSCEFVYGWNCSGGGGSGTSSTNPPNDGEDDSTTSTGTGGNTNGGNNNDDDTTTTVPMEDPTPIWQPIERCINGLLIGGTDNTTIDPEIFSQIKLNLGQWSAINNYLQNNNCSEDAQEFIIAALKILETEDCTVIPLVSNVSQITDDYDPNRFGDSPDPATQQNHAVIKSQYESLISSNNKLEAVNYLINSYNLDTFGPNSVNGDYSIVFDPANTNEAHTTCDITIFPSGTFEVQDCQITLENGLLGNEDFGYTVRSIKHELLHVLQRNNSGPNISSQAMEFDAYYFSMFRFKGLPVGSPETYTRWAIRVQLNWKLLSLTEKLQRQNSYDKFKTYFPEICKQ